MSQKTNNNFSGYLGFIAASVAAAVGLSNIWKFPAEAAKYGGGIYVSIYLACVVLIGYPIILSELSFGRSKGRGLYELYKDKGRWRFVGLYASITCFLIFVFYNVVSGWVLAYVWHFLKGFFVNTEGSLYHLNPKDPQQFGDFFSEVREHFWGNAISTFLMVVFAILILQAGVSGGIEKCAKVLMPVFILFMIVLIGYSFSLDNAMKGVKHYVTPVPKNFSLAALASALGQSLMSLGIGVGALVTYGAYVDKGDNLRKSSLIIGLGDTAVAFFAGLFVFAFLGHNNPDIANSQIEGGTGLAFKTIPMVFMSFSNGLACLFGAIFFLLVFFAAITSSISLLEVPARYVESTLGMERKKSLWLVAVISYMLSLGCIAADSFYPGENNLHGIFQKVVIDALTPFSTFLFSLFIAMKWQVASLYEEAYQEGEKRNKYFLGYVTISVKYLCPLVTGFAFLHSLYALFT